MVNIGNDWDALLASEFEKEYYKKLRMFLKSEYSNSTIYPDKYDIFNALKYTAYKNVKVVILGQDPYHGPGQAHGLCFSVKPGVPKPPSLVNIFEELRNEVSFEAPSSGDLSKWAENGILLLNTVLTVRAGEAGSHRGKGWEILTDKIIELLNERKDPMVFLLWGANAGSKEPLLDKNKHLVLKSPHPSPLSAYRGFFGNGHFTAAQAFLSKNGIDLDWNL